MKKPAAQPSEIQAELLELAGSAANYTQLLDNLQVQMSQAAQKRGKIDLNLDILAAAPAKRGIGRRIAAGSSGAASPQRQRLESRLIAAHAFDNGLFRCLRVVPEVARLTFMMTFTFDWSRKQGRLHYF